MRGACCAARRCDRCLTCAGAPHDETRHRRRPERAALRSTAARRGSTSQAGRASAHARPASPAHRRDAASYIIEQLKAAGIKAREQPFIGMTPLGEVLDGRTSSPRFPARRAERIVARQPLRHQAVSRVPVRRRQRRRLVHGGAPRARPRAQGARRTSSRSSCCSSTARRRACRSGAAPTTPTAAVTTSRRRRQTGTLAEPEGARAARHDRRSRSATSGATRTRRRG